MWFEGGRVQGCTLGVEATLVSLPLNVREGKVSGHLH